VTPVELAELIMPGTQDVADVIPRRAIDEDGLGRGDFTVETVPTAEQVARIAAAYALEVAASLPNLREELYTQARQVAAVGAASAVETSFYPEQQDSGTAGQSLAIRYRTSLATLARANSSAGAAATPRGSFPAPGPALAEFAERLWPWMGPW
jgi:hypothetical protein